jgi:hypothetical protein
MRSWRAEKDFCDAASEVKFRETVMSTIEPEDISGGRRIEGNSILIDLLDVGSVGGWQYELFSCLP